MDDVRSVFRTVGEAANAVAPIQSDLVDAFTPDPVLVALGAVLVEGLESFTGSHPDADLSAECDDFKVKIKAAITALDVFGKKADAYLALTGRIPAEQVAPSLVH